MKILKEYSGVLGFRERSKAKIDLLEDEAAKYPLGSALSVGSTYVTVNFVGYDHGDYIIRFLVSLARILINAKGEIECAIAEDGRKHTRDRLFTFYFIKDGRLWKQAGWTCRAQEISEVEVAE